MNYIPSNRRWMYDRCYSGRSGLKQSFVDGVHEFITKAVQQPRYHNDGGIRCPCVKCDCTRILGDRVVKVHLYKNGFKPSYWIWTDHGEDMSHFGINDDISYMDASNSAPNVDQQEQLLLMQDMVCDAFRQPEAFEPPNSYTMEEPPNDDTQRFYSLLVESNQPLYEGAADSKLSISARLLACKSNWNVPDQCLEFISKMLLDVTPIKENLPKNFYDAKRLVSKLGLEAKRIDCCVDGCMLYYNNDGALTECKFCNKPRYYATPDGKTNAKPVPVKAMFYLPIIPRLQRMFASMQSAGHMTWHHYNRSSIGMLRHPCDGEAWKHFDRVHADFAIDPRNVRLGLCSDGFNPYIQASSSPYSCWPIIVTPYNLPPELCMTKPYMFLTCVVPGPSPSSVCMPNTDANVVPPAVPPSPVPTSTPFPTTAIGNMPTDEDRGSMGMEDPPLNDRPTITLMNGAFYPSKVAAKAVTLSIRQQFDNAWPTWGAIPKDQQDLFFQRFKRKLVWRPEDEDEIKKAFNSKASHRLSEMFRDARKENKRPYWIGDRVWNDLLSHWNAPEYRSKCTQAKKNRASEKGGCMHTGGSISLQDHAIRLSQELGRSAFLDEIFQQTHLRKDTGEFVDDRSRHTHENFEARLSQAKSDAASSVGESEMTPLDPAEEKRLRTECWLAAAGPKQKGRVYGLGDVARSYRCSDNTFMQHMPGSSSQATDSAEVNRLREELRQTKEEVRALHSVVLKLLPPEDRNIFEQQQPHEQHLPDPQQPDHQLPEQQQQQNDEPHDQQQQQDHPHRDFSKDYSDY